MGDIIQLVGPNQAVQILGVKLVGVNADNGKKLLFTIVFLALALLLARLVKAATRTALRGRAERTRFWARQFVNLATAGVMIIGLFSIWFDDPRTLATALGLVTAGLAFALQRVITALAGYLIILRGDTFNVGDRIVMGGVRGDVIAVDFTQTTIMEMGQPPGEQSDVPSMWVRGRQYTGRLVSISNAKIFDEPVYNYTRDFPYIWEEMAVPVAYRADRKRAERILLEVASRHTTKLNEMSEESLQEMERRYAIRRSELGPRVFFRLTDNWLEMSIRFVAPEHGVRNMKDAMSREIYDAFEEAGIGIASAGYEVLSVPDLRVRAELVNSPEGRPAV